MDQAGKSSAQPRFGRHRKLKTSLNLRPNLFSCCNFLSKWRKSPLSLQMHRMPSSPVSQTVAVLPPILQTRLTSSDQKISKRALLHPAIPSPRTNASSPKIIYVSASTPFISTVKRVRSLLSHIETRAAGPIDFSSGPYKAFKQIEAGIAKRRSGAEKGGEEVVIKGTGRAVEKVLRLATWWQAQDDVRVTIRTGSVGAVDDVLGEDGEEEGSRVRRTSCLEVGIRLR